MKPVELVLDRLEGVKKNGSGWIARCPGHEDRTPSLSISEGRDGRVLTNCFSCGREYEEIMAALGLKPSDGFLARGEGACIPPNNGGTPQEFKRSAREGLTLSRYAEAKGLNLASLKSFGLSEFTYMGAPAVRVPYVNEVGGETAARFRIGLTGDERFRWRKDSKTSLYGLNRLGAAREAGFVVLVEGESDCHTLWQADIPAIGLPGASTWREARDAPALDGIENIYIVWEPDQGGDAVLGWLASSSIRERVRLVSLGEHKDVSDLFLAAPPQFASTLKAALARSIPYEEHERLEKARARREAWIECQELARSDRILDEFAEDLERAGLVGETRTAKIVYLAVLSRLFDRPISVVVKGPSSAGKSWVVKQVLRLCPPEAFHVVTSMSDHALAYSDEPLVHRILVVYEAAGLESETKSYFMRTLLSEGHIRHETVEKTADGMKPLVVEREGPTGLLMTTTATRLHPENETRLLSLSVTDGQEQTSAIFVALADEDRPADPDAGRWHALHRWIASGPTEVTIPYGKELARMIPPVAVRLRRDFGQILALIRVHALLYQASRDKDDHGRVVATFDDYAAVRELVYSLVAEGVEVTVPSTVRETVEAVPDGHTTMDGALLPGEGASLPALATTLNLDKSTVSRRVRDAINRGYLRDLSGGQKGRPMQLVRGEAMPEDRDVLPTVEKLEECCSVAGVREGTPSPFPLLGDDGFRAFLNSAFERGHITARERHARRLLNDALRRAERLRSAGVAA